MKNLKTFEQHLNEKTYSYNGDYDEVEYEIDGKTLKPGDKFKIKNPGKWDDGKEREPRYLGKKDNWIIYDFGKDGVKYKTEKEDLK